MKVLADELLIDVFDNILNNAVKFNYDNEEIILDPFNDGRLVDIDDLQEILDRNFDGQLEFEPEFLDEIKSEQVLVRLARNLKHSYFQSYANEKALKCVNMTLAIEPESPEDIRDKGMLEEKLLNHVTALKYLNQYYQESTYQLELASL